MFDHLEEMVCADKIKRIEELEVENKELRDLVRVKIIGAVRGRIGDKGLADLFEALQGAVEGIRARRARLEALFKELRALVNAQAEDEGLWFEAVYASEAYLQQELRRLHAAIEQADTK